MTPLAARLSRCLRAANQAFGTSHTPNELAHRMDKASRLAWQWFVYEMLHGEESCEEITPAGLALLLDVRTETVLRARSDEVIRRTLFPWPSQIHDSLAAQRSGLLSDNPPAWEDDVSPANNIERTGRRELAV